MKKKQIIRLTEGDLHKIIKESVNNVLKENLFKQALDYYLKKGYTREGAKSQAKKAIENNDYSFMTRKKDTNKRKINEVFGWKLEEDDYIDINSDQQEYYGKCYVVRIWPGSGYLLPAYKVYANHEEEALEIVVAWLEKNEPNMLQDDNYNEALQDGEDENELETVFLYVDATMEGASQPHYIYSENLRIYEYKG